MKNSRAGAHRKDNFRKLAVKYIMCIMLFVWTATFANGQEAMKRYDGETAPDKKDYSLESFSLIFEKNIFDPNRNATHAVETNVEAKPVPVLEAEFIELTGVIISEEGAVAFFDASNPEDEGLCEEGMAVAGFFLMDIQNGGVLLDNGEQLVLLPVGARLGRLGDEKWQVESILDRPIYRRPLTAMETLPDEDDQNNQNSPRDIRRARRMMNQTMQQLFEGGGIGEIMRRMSENEGEGAVLPTLIAPPVVGDGIGIQSFTIDGSNANVNYDLFISEPDR